MPARLWGRPPGGSLGRSAGAASAFVVAGSGVTRASDWTPGRVAAGVRLVCAIESARPLPVVRRISSNSQPVAWQKCSKSLTAPGSVASTSSTDPGASGFNARRAFNTGSGHKSPVVSRVVALSAVLSVMAGASLVSDEVGFSGSAAPAATRLKRSLWPCGARSVELNAPVLDVEPEAESVERPAGDHGRGRYLQVNRGNAHPNLFDRGKPLGTRRPIPPRPPSQGVRSVSVRVRVSPWRHVRPAARRNTLASARPPDL